MAYWGESLTYNHPLNSGMDPTEPRRVLERLAPTRVERLAKAPTEREKGFLNAVEILWGEGDRADRTVGYMDAMGRLYERYPNDTEVAAFYALSMLSASTATRDLTQRLNVRAGTISLNLFEHNPDHPGAAHYTIHAFDSPVLAPLSAGGRVPLFRDRSRRCPRDSHADAHLHSTRHVGQGLGQQRVRLHRRERVVEAGRTHGSRGPPAGLGPVRRSSARGLQKGEIVDRSDREHGLRRCLPRGRPARRTGPGPGYPHSLAHEGSLRRRDRRMGGSADHGRVAGRRASGDGSERRAYG